jgi:hypothetical protein
MYFQFRTLARHPFLQEAAGGRLLKVPFQAIRACFLDLLQAPPRGGGRIKHMGLEGFVVLPVTVSGIKGAGVSIIWGKEGFPAQVPPVILAEEGPTLVPGVLSMVGGVGVMWEVRTCLGGQKLHGMKGAAEVLAVEGEGEEAEMKG